MSTTWQDWEPLHGQPPYTLLATHPNGQFVVRQVTAWTNTTVERAAIWDAQTQKLVWNPGNANAICWTTDGNEVVLIRDPYDPDLIAKGAPYEHFFERRAWPSLEIIESVAYEIPDGWAVGLVMHPTRKLVCVEWRDQGCSGVGFVSWESGSAVSMKDGEYSVSTNLNSDAVFSPDGKHLVCAYGEHCWWTTDPEKPSKGGTFQAGLIVIQNLETWEPVTAEVILSVRKGWRPHDPEDTVTPSLFSQPRFLDAERFEVRAGTGELLQFRLGGERVA